MAAAHPTDRTTFPETVIPRLRVAVDELSWLLGRGYAEDSALTLVGNRHQLDSRQRMAVRRCACSEAVAQRRRAARCEQPTTLAVDGFNQLVTVERALSGGAVLRGRDSALRDVASVHGTWRTGEDTQRALELFVQALPATGVTWVLDAPVSNSGRLAGLLREVGPGWSVEVVGAADTRLAELASQGHTVGTSDGGLIDRVAGWVPLVERVLLALPEAWIVDLGEREAGWPSG
jgi:hypothetical protein